MQSLNFIDGVVLVLVILSGLHAYSRGLVIEIIKLICWVGAFIIAFIFAPQVMPLLKNLPNIGSYLFEDCSVKLLLSFILVFFVSLGFLSFLVRIVSPLVDRGPVGKLDTAMGFLYGVTRAIALFFVIFFTYKTFSNLENYEVIDESVSATVFEIGISEIENLTPSQQTKRFVNAYQEFIANCE